MSETRVLSDKQRKKDDNGKMDFVCSIAEESKDEESQVHLGAHDETEEIGT